MSAKIVGASESRRPLRDSAFSRPVSRAAFAAGLIYLVGSVTDLGILWLAQRQPGVQWEFVAITNTVEAWPRMVLAIGLLYAALYFAGSMSVVAYRVLGAGLLGLGIVALALGGLMVLNYLQVSGNLQGDAAGLIRSSVLKTELLCALYVVTLGPIGGLGLRGFSAK